MIQRIDFEMQRKFIASIVIAALVVIFSMQNLEPVTVDLLFWGSESPVAMVVIFSFGLGALASALFSVPSLVSKNNTIRKLQKELKNHQDSGEKNQENEPEEPPKEF